MTSDRPPHLFCGRRRRATTLGDGRYDEPIDGLDERNLRILDQVFHEAALDASEDDSPPTTQEIEAERALAARLEHTMKRRSKP